MICKNCGFDNAEGAKFCCSCGTQLEGGATPDKPKTPVSQEGCMMFFLLVLNIIILFLLLYILGDLNMVKNDFYNMQNQLGGIEKTLGTGKYLKVWSDPPSIYEMLHKIFENVPK